MKVVPSFHGYQQQDAQEFMRYLLDAMNSELMVQKGKTLIQSLFQGTLMNKIQCLICNGIFPKEEAFLDLSLPIPDQSDRENISLEGNPFFISDCLDAFTELENLENGEQYQCPNCKKLEKATKKMTIMKLPAVSIYLFLRYSPFI